MSARPGFRQGYPTVLDALLGGEPAAFDALTSKGLVVPVSIKSQEIDFAAVANTSFGGDWPTLAGYFFLPMAGRHLLTVISGSQSVNGLFKVGTNGTFDNVLAQQTLTAATLASIVSSGATKQAALNGVLGTTMAYPELTAVPTVSVTQATSAPCKGKICLSGFVLPVIP